MSRDNEQISPRQMTFLVITMVISTADIFLPAFVAQEARRDSWLSAIFAVAAILPVIWIILKLYQRHEGKTLIQICRELVGKPVAIAIGLFYIIFFLMDSCARSVEMSIVLNTAYMPLTPPWALLITTIAVSIYSVSKDVEVIARINEILLPLGVAALVILLLVNLKDMDLNFFRPVLAHGIVPSLLGGFVITGYFGETVVILQLMHFVNKPDRLGRAVYKGILITGLGILGGTLIYALFGPLTESLLMPALEFARFASIGTHIQNFDLLIMAIWISGIYVKITIYYYAGTYALAQLFEVNYKTLVLPVGLLLFSISLVIEARTVSEFLYFSHYILPFYSTTMAFVIPAILLFVSLVKGKKSSRKVNGEERRRACRQNRKKEEEGASQ